MSLKSLAIISFLVICFAAGVLTTSTFSNASGQAPSFCQKHPNNPNCKTTSTTTTTTTTVPTGITPPSSIAHDCSTDVTSAMLSWLATIPDGSTIDFGSGCYRIESTLELRNRNLTLDNGTFKSLNPEVDGVYADDQRAMWRFLDSTIVISGMTLTGPFVQSDTSPKIDESIQHAHAIDLRGTAANISSVTATGLGGDCVYFGQSYYTGKHSSGSVSDLTCRRISRNAVSVTSGDNITIQRVTSSGIGFDAFDIEPNAGEGSTNVSISNSNIGTYYLYAYSIVPIAPISSQQFLNNTSSVSMRVAVISKSYRPQGVTISGNVANGATPSPAMNIDSVDGLTVQNNNIPTSTLLQCSSITNLVFSGNTPSTKVGC